MASNDDESFSDPLSGEVTRCEVTSVHVLRPPQIQQIPSEFRILITAGFILRGIITPPEQTPNHVMSCLFPVGLPGPTREDVLSMLRVVRVLPQRGVPGVVQQILECCRRMAFGVLALGSFLNVNVNIDLLVDEIPWDDDDTISMDEEEVNHLEFGEVRDFVPAREEAIEGLERVRVEGSEETGCVVCLEDIRVGSEAIRLPCQHQFHGDCIVKWLNTSKFCPLCRFELPS